MTIPQEVIDIAGKLTKAQRDWIIAPGYIDPNTIRSLRRKRLVESYQRGLTPLGLSVRAHLREITNERL